MSINGESSPRNVYYAASRAMAIELLSRQNRDF